MRRFVCRYCGQVLGNKLAGPILSFSKPFVVRTKTDSAEPHGGVAINNRGYRLTYKQIPGSVERHNTAAFSLKISYLQSVKICSVSSK